MGVSKVQPTSVPLDSVASYLIYDDMRSHIPMNHRDGRYAYRLQAPILRQEPGAGMYRASANRGKNWCDPKWSEHVSVAQVFQVSSKS